MKFGVSDSNRCQFFKFAKVCNRYKLFMGCTFRTQRKILYWLLAIAVLFPLCHLMMLNSHTKYSKVSTIIASFKRQMYYNNNTTQHSLFRDEISKTNEKSSLQCLTE